MQFERNQFFGNVNCEDLHPEISNLVDKEKIPQTTIFHEPQVLAKASFGFGDVNACVVFRRFEGLKNSKCEE